MTYGRVRKRDVSGSMIGDKGNLFEWNLPPDRSLDRRDLRVSPTLAGTITIIS
jgi:hypothetical protein